MSAFLRFLYIYICGKYIFSLLSEIGEETSSCADCVSGPKSCTCSSDVACSVDAEYLVHLELEVRLLSLNHILNVKTNMAKCKRCRWKKIAKTCAWQILTAHGDNHS